MEERLNLERGGEGKKKGRGGEAERETDRQTEIETGGGRI